MKKLFVLLFSISSVSWAAGDPKQDTIITPKKDGRSVIIAPTNASGARTEALTATTSGVNVGVPLTASSVSAPLVGVTNGSSAASTDVGYEVTLSVTGTTVSANGLLQLPTTNMQLPAGEWLVSLYGVFYNANTGNGSFRFDVSPTGYAQSPQYVSSQAVHPSGGDSTPSVLQTFTVKSSSTITLYPRFYLLGCSSFNSASASMLGVAIRKR